MTRDWEIGWELPSKDNKKLKEIIWVSPTFQKFVLYHFAFYKRPTLVPVFANRKKSEEDFSLL